MTDCRLGVAEGLTWMAEGLTWMAEGLTCVTGVCHCGHRAAIHAGIITMALGAAIGQVRQQHFQHHLLALDSALAAAVHLHAGCDLAAATRRQLALALDFNHASAAIAGNAQPLLEAKMRNLDAVTLRRLQDALTLLCLQRRMVELEGQFCHVSRQSRVQSTSARSAPGSVLPGRGRRSRHRP